MTSKLHRALEKANPILFTAFAGLTGFAAYFSMYAFRKPFSAAVFTVVPGWHFVLDYKIALVLGRDLPDGEALLRTRHRITERQSRHHPVDGMHLRPVRARVHQEGQAEVPGTCAVPRLVTLLLVAQVGGVPVMAVGDRGPARGKVLGDRS